MSPPYPKYQLPTGLISLLLFTPLCLLYFNFTSPPQQNGVEIRAFDGIWDQVGYYIDFKVNKTNPALSYQLDTLTNFLIATQKSKHGQGLPRLLMSRHCSCQEFVNIVDLLHTHDHSLLLYNGSLHIISGWGSFFDDAPYYPNRKYDAYFEPWWESILYDIKGRALSDYHAVTDAISTDRRYAIFLFYWFLMLLYSIFKMVHNHRRRLTSGSS